MFRNAKRGAGAHIMPLLQMLSHHAHDNGRDRDLVGETHRNEKFGHHGSRKDEPRQSSEHNAPDTAGRFGVDDAKVSSGQILCKRNTTCQPEERGPELFFHNARMPHEPCRQMDGFNGHEDFAFRRLTGEESTYDFRLLQRSATTKKARPEPGSMNTS